MTSQAKLLEVSLAQLASVTGGMSSVVPPLTPMPNMGAPKYSAPWWDIVRSRGGDR